MKSKRQVIYILLYVTEIRYIINDFIKQLLLLISIYGTIVIYYYNR